jgi:hypothetical protein
MIMASISQALLVTLPLHFLVENASAQFFVGGSCMFIVAMAILLLIIVPKILAWMQTSTSNNNNAELPSRLATFHIFFYGG